jgi:DNA-binding response OmpR family regulator
MSQAGYFVLAATDGQEGMELSRQYPESIDLVITSVAMTHMNGIDLCVHLLEERPGIKVLVMSDADASEVVAQKANLPFLPKPINGRVLRAIVRTILNASVPPPTHLLPSDQPRRIQKAISTIGTAPAQSSRRRRSA